MIGRGLAFLSWAALIAGMIWTGKTPEVGTPPPPPPLPSTEVTLHRPDAPSILSIEAASSGAAPWRLAVDVFGEADALALQEWLTPDRERPVIARLTAEQGEEAPRQIEVPGSDLSYVDSRVEADRARWILHQGKIEVEKGRRYSFRFEVEGADAERLRERDPVVLLGRSVESLPVPVQTPRAPGFLLLAGALGVFTHLFLIFGRLMIPYREPIPDGADLI